jgi:uncharacterized protein GlcG (DUF336 family)
MVKDHRALVDFPAQVRVQGGLPIMHDGLRGRVGVSGAAFNQDADVARAGMAALA